MNIYQQLELLKETVESLYKENDSLKRKNSILKSKLDEQIFKNTAKHVCKCGGNCKH